MTTPRLLAELHATHDWLASHDLLPAEQRTDSLPNPYVRLRGRRVVSFCSNNYLGLNHAPSVRATAAAALHAHGHATSESRRLGGNLRILEQLENDLADFKKAPAAMVTATGLLANIAAVHGLLEATHLAHRWHGSPPPSGRPVVIYDEMAHQSIRMGARVSAAAHLRFRHNDTNHLSELLAQHAGSPALVATDGVFSMDGDLADLPGLVEVCEHHGALLLVDDAHGTGVYGTDGSGTPHHFGLRGRIPLHVVTLSKALAGMGGAVLGDERTIAMLRTYASGYRFTSSLPAEQAAAAIAALRLLRSDHGVRERLWTNVRRLRAGLTRLGIHPPGDGPIIPLRLGPPNSAAHAEQTLLAAGFWCAAVTPPAVAPDACRIRITVTAMHTEEHIDTFLNAITKIIPLISNPHPRST
ncbi:aminotransferase class I/II-fold pyridoxal phosphate-dependent enzyme [Streptomyces sp. 4N509B]|uniref:aminotransferase class I/II-fold pyridoxal phosphate-dependent enzyme n=1 Tax=Streptomyces sp. 4N509B TaxID=3457413 RepID=UPI003FD54A09